MIDYLASYDEDKDRLEAERPTDTVRRGRSSQLTSHAFNSTVPPEIFNECFEKGYGLARTVSREQLRREYGLKDGRLATDLAPSPGGPKGRGLTPQGEE